MKKESSKENKPAGFKTLINVLRPIRDWLKNTPSIARIPNERASVSSSSTKSNLKSSSATLNGIIHTNQKLGDGAVEFNTHLMRQQQLQQQQQQQHNQQLQQQQIQHQQLYSQPNLYRRSHLSLHPPPPPPLPRPAPIIGNQHFNSMPPNQQQQPQQPHYYSTTPISVLNSNNSSTPISNNNNSSAREDTNSTYMMSTATTMQRHTPIINGTGMITMDDLNGSINTNGMVEERFKRNAKARMSLPIMQQQNKLRRQAYSQLQRRGHYLQPQSLGHIYLQHNGETKQANLPDELTATDTIRALFVCAFPNMLTMEYMSQPYVKIYIYNPSCNIFYELHNIDDVKHESVLRIHQGNPIIALPPQPQYQMRMVPQIPPPKPRRMIPINGGIQQNPDAIYGVANQSPHRIDHQQQQPQQQLQPQQLQLQTTDQQHQQPVYGSSTPSNIYSYGRNLPALPQVPPPPPQVPIDFPSYTLERGSFCQMIQ